MYMYTYMHSSDLSLHVAAAGLLTGIVCVVSTDVLTYIVVEFDSGQEPPLLLACVIVLGILVLVCSCSLQTSVMYAHNVRL